MRTQPRRRLPSSLHGNAAWEAVEAARGSYGHDEAVRRSEYLTRQYREMWRNQGMPSPVDLKEILYALTQKKVPFVLTGAYGIAGWTGRPRATQDVDILVKGGRNYVRAVNAIKALYPALEAKEFHGVMGFFLPGERDSLIDVTYPHRADNAETLANPVWVDDRALGLRYRIPALENALANKYGAMLALNRHPGKRAIDVGDFTWMVTHSLDEGRQPIDLQKLESLGELVWPGGGGAEILRLVEQVKAGRVIDLSSLGIREPS